MHVHPPGCAKLPHIINPSHMTNSQFPLSYSTAAISALLLYFMTNNLLLGEEWPVQNSSGRVVRV